MVAIVESGKNTPAVKIGGPGLRPASTESLGPGKRRATPLSSGDSQKALLHRPGQSDGKKEIPRVEIVFTRLLDDPQQTMPGRRQVWNDFIEFPALQRDFVTLIPKTNGKSFFFRGLFHRPHHDHAFKYRNSIPGKR
jgi:hypothetical protein